MIKHYSNKSRVLMITELISVSSSSRHQSSSKHQDPTRAPDSGLKLLFNVMKKSSRKKSEKYFIWGENMKRQIKQCSTYTAARPKRVWLQSRLVMIGCLIISWS